MAVIIYPTTSGPRSFCTLPMSYLYLFQNGVERLIQLKNGLQKHVGDVIMRQSTFIYLYETRRNHIHFDSHKKFYHKVLIIEQEIYILTHILKQKPLLQANKTKTFITYSFHNQTNQVFLIMMKDKLNHSGKHHMLSRWCHCLRRMVV